jgi:hypothetical protein
MYIRVRNITAGDLPEGRLPGKATFIGVSTPLLCRILCEIASRPFGVSVQLPGAEGTALPALPGALW